MVQLVGPKQNIPIKSERGKGFFREGYTYLISDYSSLEMRIVAQFMEEYGRKANS